MADIANAVEDGQLDQFATIVPINKLTKTQDTLETRVLDEMLAASQLPPIFVVKAGGDLFIEDGHHRVAHASRQNLLGVKAVVCEKVGKFWRVCCE
jgi:hypothetical protein